MWTPRGSKQEEMACTSRQTHYYTVYSCKIWDGARGSVFGWGTMLQAGRSPVRVPDEVDFFNLPNPSSRTMALESTQTLTEMSTRNLPGVTKRPARRADNLTAACEPNACKLWEPQPLTTLRGTTACTGIGPYGGKCHSPVGSDAVYDGKYVPMIRMNLEPPSSLQKSNKVHVVRFQVCASTHRKIRNIWGTGISSLILIL
jgi:hypothetical protein